MIEGVLQKERGAMSVAAKKTPAYRLKYGSSGFNGKTSRASIPPRGPTGALHRAEGVWVSGAPEARSRRRLAERVGLARDPHPFAFAQGRLFDSSAFRSRRIRKAAARYAVSQP